MRKCEEIFNRSIHLKLLYLKLYFEITYSFNANDLLPMIKSHIKFTEKDHIGGVVPLYYQCGLPCRRWVCVTCKAEI